MEIINVRDYQTETLSRTIGISIHLETTMKKTRRQSVKTMPKTANGPADASDTNDDVSERIRTTLAAAIGQGALKPGSKILEDAIADHFGVSRTVVRGALGVLESDHLLDRKRNRGTFVAEPSIEEAKALFEARRVLENTILEMAVARASTADLNRLDALTEEEDRIHDGTDETAKTGLSGQFHIELAKIGGNGVLTELLGKVVARLSLVMALYENEHHDDCGADHHRSIVAAVRRKDVKSAQQLMSEHLADIEGRVRLTQDHGDRHSFEAVLASFSSQ